MHNVQHADHVRLVLGAQLYGGYLFYRAHLSVSGDIQQGVELAELLAGQRQRGVDRRTVGHVYARDNGVFQFCEPRIGGSHVAHGGHNVPSALRVLEDGGLTQTGAGACNQDGFAHGLAPSSSMTVYVYVSWWRCHRWAVDVPADTFGAW